MWHASVSLWEHKSHRLADERTCERAAIEALCGVGGDREWWQWGPSLVGHLRVPVTPAEASMVPPGIVTTDAGPEGIARPRSR